MGASDDVCGAALVTAAAPVLHMCVHMTHICVLMTLWHGICIVVIDLNCLNTHILQICHNKPCRSGTFSSDS